MLAHRRSLHALTVEWLMCILDCTALKLLTVCYVGNGLGWREFVLPKLTDNVYVSAAQTLHTLLCLAAWGLQA